jgi:hypothetical protein
VTRPLRCIVIAFVAVFGLALLPACGKHTGSACKPGESLCTTKEAALTCQNGKFVDIACRGPLGCNRFQNHANCDTTISNVGDPCMAQADEEYACSPDKKQALLCKNGRFDRYLECRGPSGCSLLGAQVSCDTSIAKKGDPCKVQKASACSDDKKELLVCQDGKFVEYRFCRGQLGCYMKGDAPACDETLSIEGDPCGLPGYVVCSTDHQSELVCQGGQFVKSRACKSGCTVITRVGGGIDCK